MNVTLTLVALTVLVSALGWMQPALKRALIYWPPGVAQGQWWRLISHGLLHANVTHLAFNMVTLYVFGTVMELVLVPHIGVLGFVLFYVAGLLIAILPTHLRHRRDASYLSLGASGAVAAVLFAYILLRPWSLLFVFVVPVPAIAFAALYVIYSLWAQRHADDNVNHSAHLWGGAWGLTFMLGLMASTYPNELI
ncbi:Membrane associated serine protease, rhomboid family [Franzmannia pantelleriensis]|uniref:Membrane associated serine protease, rhomboid family n=1 Tax=Franzmannia pantelleriensis TaxID=48727 RepID=A0A1G9PG03_9GAMM|nr:rhomboid family intramembrane serine protease [Halomonas pantelleriensis]SDL97147.1 Membrane associated serine protease, rhomboid family [Halomonas pantelleriensis]